MTRDWADAPFVRIYNSVFEDEKFAPICALPFGFYWYTRLLVNAKAYWPTRAPLLRSVPQKVVDALVTAEVIVVDGDFYTVSGLGKEMDEVRDGHRAGGLVRAATAERNEQGRFGGTAPAPEVAIPDGRADIEAFAEVTRRAPSPGQRRVLDIALSNHEVTGPKWAADIIYANPRNPIEAVLNADREEQGQRKAGAVKQEQESAQSKRRGIQDPLIQEIAKAMSERVPA